MHYLLNIARRPTPVVVRESSTVTSHPTDLPISIPCDLIKHYMVPHLVCHFRRQELLSLSTVCRGFLASVKEPLLVMRCAGSQKLRAQCKLGFASKESVLNSQVLYEVLGALCTSSLVEVESGTKRHGKSNAWHTWNKNAPRVFDKLTDQRLFAYTVLHHFADRIAVNMPIRDRAVNVMLASILGQTEEGGDLVLELFNHAPEPLLLVGYIEAVMEPRYRAEEASEGNWLDEPTVGEFLEFSAFSINHWPQKHADKAAKLMVTALTTTAQAFNGASHLDSVKSAFFKVYNAVACNMHKLESCDQQYDALGALILTSPFEAFDCLPAAMQHAGVPDLHGENQAKNSGNSSANPMPRRLALIKQMQTLMLTDWKDNPKQRTVFLQFIASALEFKDLDRLDAAYDRHWRQAESDPNFSSNFELLGSALKSRGETGGFKLCSLV
jgi:hypothetical protein